MLEWIQVLPSYRGRGLGLAIVTKLLSNMKSHADFATVSGQITIKQIQKAYIDDVDLQGMIYGM